MLSADDTMPLDAENSGYACIEPRKYRRARRRFYRRLAIANAIFAFAALYRHLALS